MPLFKTTQSHICTVYESTSNHQISERRSRSKWTKRNCPRIWKWTTLWEHNPQTIEFYRSEVEMKQKRLEHISSYYWVIHPFSKFRSFYEIWIALVLTFQLCYIPVNLSFNLIMVHEKGFKKFSHSYYNTTAHTIFYITKWFILIDVVINFFTGYVKHHKVILKPRKIALHYLFSLNFVSDVLSSIPYIPHSVRNVSDVIMESLQIFKLFRISTCVTYINRSGDLFHIKNKWFDFGFFLAELTVVLHWYACILFFIPQIRLYKFGVLDPHSWLIFERSLWSSLGGQYLHNLYIATSLVYRIHTPFGDGIKGKGIPWEEELLVMVYYFTGKILTDLFMVILLNIFLSMRSLETKYQHVMTQVSKFMIQQHLPIDMQRKVCTFYQYKYNSRYFKDTVVNDILSGATLRNEIRYHECSSMIKNVPLFAHLPKFILGKILNELVPEIFMADDIIIKHGGVGDCMYFLSSGTVAVYTPSGKEICHLQDGSHFGEVALVLKGKKRMATIKAVEICELYRLDKKAFKACFAKNTEIFEQLQETARQRTEHMDKIDVEHKAAKLNKSMMI